MYMKFDNGLYLVSAEAGNGYKPMTTTEEPTAPEGYHAAFYWRETEDAFVQTWEIVETVDEVEDTEALEIILGGAE